jgi:hypothetical protein
MSQQGAVPPTSQEVTESYRDPDENNGKKHYCPAN